MFLINDIIINFLSYIYQIGVFLYAVSKCLQEERKKDVIRWVMSFFICLLIGIILNFLLDSYSICIIEIHSISFFLVCGIVYREKLNDAMVAYSVCYYECFIYSITKHVLFSEEIRITYGNILSAMIFMILYMYEVKRVVKVYKNMKNEKYYRFLIIVLSFVADLFLVFDEITEKNEVRTLQLTIFKMFLLFFIFNIIYFGVRYFKVKRIVRLNSKLNYMNNELRNIKDYHGKIIFNIYNLYLRGNNDEIGIMLKDIINNDNDESKVIKSENVKNNSILDIALMQAVKDGINVNIDEKCSLELACIDKMELYRIIANIINNARRFVGKNGVINVNTYKEEKSIIVIIENNGPKIEQSNLEKIFQTGFTTKDNSDRSHGYGLNIVKELVEKNNGNIEVNSTDLITSFKISLPCD